MYRMAHPSYVLYTLSIIPNIFQTIESLIPKHLLPFVSGPLVPTQFRFWQKHWTGTTDLGFLSNVWFNSPWRIPRFDSTEALDDMPWNNSTHLSHSIKSKVWASAIIISIQNILLPWVGMCQLLMHQVPLWHIFWSTISFANLPVYRNIAGKTQHQQTSAITQLYHCLTDPFSPMSYCSMMVTKMMMFHANVHHSSSELHGLFIVQHVDTTVSTSSGHIRYLYELQFI